MINGRIAYASIEDFTVMGGTLGEYHSKKSVKSWIWQLKCVHRTLVSMTLAEHVLKRESAPLTATAVCFIEIHRLPGLFHRFP